METTIRQPQSMSTPTFGARYAIERHGLLIYAALAFGITWSLLVGAYLAISAGVLDPDGAFVAFASQVAPAGPLIAAIILIALSRGRAGLGALGRSLIRWRVHPLWYALVFLGIPGLIVGVMSVLHGPAAVSAITDQWQTIVTRLPVIIVGTAIFTGLAEEPGWRGYAQPAANERYQPFVAALVVSLVWALWHLPNALFGQTVPETALHILATVINGLVLAWIYNSTRGSLLIVILAHGAMNATAGLFVRLLGETPAGVSISDYYVISAVTFGAVIAVVLVLTKGRLGLRASDATTASG